ncbi:MAG: argininosuccinate lyase [Treponema sp.]|nr:argininosuccinate lyase [Treponema sp.]
MAQVLWSGRLEEKPEAEAFAFESSISVDSRLAQEDIAGSRAHVAMLVERGIIPAEAARAIDEELKRIAAELASGKLAIDQNAEDIHSFIEGVLTERLGDAGRMVHAGRSRNDQVAVDLRLYLKRVVPEIAEEIRATCETLLTVAEQHLETVMPGYTHLQRAQPVSLAHHLTAWTAGLVRDRERFLDALSRLDECPLGSGALATTTLALDREAVARSLGFPQPTVNSMDSVADRDFALELAGAAAILATHLSRFCEDIIIWATEEFGFIDLAEQWSTGSSIMPQKKNPDFAELIRGKAGRQIGNLVSLLTLLKGLPYAYDRDLQEDKEALFDALDTSRATLRMFRPMIATARFRKDRMEAACFGGFLEATDVAEYLVRKGLPFRKAHEVAAQVVRDCVAAGQRSIAERTLADLRSRSDLFDADLYEVIRPAAALRNRSRSGGPAPQAVTAQIAELRRRLG